MIKDILLVGAGSAIGGIVRLLIGKSIMQVFPYPFPLGTFIINISGSFLIGLLYALYGRSGNLSPSALLFLATGVCGGFTTFSAFSYENLLLLRSGHYMMAMVYITGSIIIGLLAVFAGYAIGK
ncbi:MAG TPA: fluoride efflux transporter CrcB [Chitinophagaceae bacterium]|jgi:CrcB protein|nr:fluoride efflux transporter CrcB [Chitinophagaceae bacterium]